MTDLVGGKVLRLRWAATCVDCGRSLMPGDRAWWFHLDDVGRCLSCAAPAPAADAPVDVTIENVEALAPSAESTPPPQQTPPPPPLTSESPDATEPPLAADPHLKPPQARAAGASAQAEYERRRREDAARLRRNRPRLLLFVVTTSLLSYVAVVIGAGLLDSQLRPIASSAVDGGVPPEPIFERWQVHVMGLVVSLGLAGSAVKAFVSSRPSTEAWRVGAAGERLTGKVLQELPSSYRVLHDLPMPRSKADIDHVVIGPSGVFTIETKNYKNGVQIKGGRVFGSGRNLDGVVQQARRQAAAVADQTGAPVIPIVCVHRGEVKVEGLFQKPIVDGVRFCSRRQLSKAISGTVGALSDRAIREIERMLLT